MFGKFIEELQEVVPYWGDSVRTKNVCVALFTSMCFLCDISPDTKECDDVLMKLYTEAEIEAQVSYEEFDLIMCNLVA